MPISVGIGQNRSIKIAWPNFDKTSQRSSKSINTEKVTKETSDYSPINLQISNETLLYQEQWQDTQFSDGKSLVVSNIVLETLSPDELKLINQKLVPKKIAYSIATSAARDILYTVFSISPVISENGVLKKIVSCSITYNRQAFGRDTQGIPLSNSIFASGNFYKFKVEQTGIQKLSKDFLSSLGMNTDGINPRNIKIYGHGGKSLPLLNAENNNFDPPQTSIEVIGEEDGNFNDGDYVLFYGTNTKGYVAENDSNLNPYSDESFYYVTADGAPGLRVQPMVEPTGNATTTITTFNETQFHELDEINPGKLGRRWFGDRFDIENEQSFEFTFPNIVAGQNMAVTVSAVAVSETGTSMAVTLNGSVLNPVTFGALGAHIYFTGIAQSYVVPASSELVTVNLAYNNSGNPSSLGLLDYIRINALRQLSGTGTQLAFTYDLAATTSGIGEYQISNASDFTEVWDVTKPLAIASKKNDAAAAIISFKSNLGETQRFVAINPSDFYIPVKVTNPGVANQNLKGSIFNDESGNFKDIDYLILVPPFLLQPALRLANFHRDLNGLNVKVVTTDKIYEEFSSGKQDISAIRNFVRYIYDNASTDDKRLKYLCLFGDSSVDYKNRLPGNNNTFPSFHTLKSDSDVSSFVSDDFFGNMDLNEGTIGQSTDIDKLDIAVGRIIADNVSLANEMVDKIVAYGSKASYGNWRNNFVLISDDVDNAGEFDYIESQLDVLGDEISAAKPFFNVKKIHSDAYQQTTSAGGNRYPEVVKAIQDDIEVGALIVNYFGHGGEDGLAKEFIYTKTVANNLRNTNKYPCIVTVTCEFTKFDNPLRITAGELTYWNREGGAISLVTTTRAIEVDLGVQFNDSLAAQLFGFTTDSPATPAEALRVSKNGISRSLRRVIFYIGDPALNLAFPKKQIELTTLNGLPIGATSDTLKALSRIRIGGQVNNAAGVLMTDYNGIVETKIFDKYVQRQTLGNDGITDGAPNYNLLILNFQTLGEGLFNGQATVTNGLFEFEFVVPRDIQIPIGNGRVSFYSQKNNEFEDNAGFNLDIKVGGLNENAPEDNDGPLIKLYMNDESFVSGGITSNSPNLIAKLEDPNGINTASGIGHDIVAVIDGDESNPFVLNEYYQADVDDFTKGVANNKFRDLADGLHTLTLKAWDVYNNSSTAEIQFVVAGSNELEINNVLNYPNPFVNYTEFWFNHNRDFDTLEVQVQVFTVTGKVVWTKNGIFPPSGSNLFRGITWDGRDDFGDKIGKGVYVYKITVKSALTNQRVEKFEKLVIL